MDELEKKILNALEERGVFIGYYMLCRYLNGRGYIRYGCNAGYEGKFKPKSNPKNRLHPCKILCPGTKIYYSKVRYWCKKLAIKKKLFLEKMIFEDSKNPYIKTKPHKRGDIFVKITRKT